MGLGGGIFGGNSLGALGDGLAGNGLPGIGRALGQPMPSWETCWRDDPNFDGCYQQFFRQAQLTCDESTAPYATYDLCVERRMQQWVAESCIPACNAFLLGGEDFPWLRKSDETCDVQKQINAALEEQGFCLIKEDCKMGPATCGASDAVGFGVPSTCVGKSWTAPKKCAPGECPPGQILVNGGCMTPPPPEVKCGVVGDPCPCCQGLECENGKCVSKVVPRPKAKKASMLWLGLAALGALGVTGYALSQQQQKKKGRRPRRRR